MSQRSRITLIIERRDPPGGATRRERFVVAWERGMTVADALSSLGDEPKTHDGQTTTPVAWSDACTWPACGVCTMLIDGRAAPACGTPITEAMLKRGKVTLAPLSAFPVLRDLVVDRSRMVSTTSQLGAYLDGDRVAAAGTRALRQAFAACTRCGACIDACPEAHADAAFIGPHAIAASMAHRTSADGAVPDVLLERGGIADCGHVQNCVEICPERIPLDEAVRAASKGGWKRWLRILVS